MAGGVPITGWAGGAVRVPGEAERAWLLLHRRRPAAARVCPVHQGRHELSHGPAVHCQQPPVHQEAYYM